MLQLHQAAALLVTLWVTTNQLQGNPPKRQQVGVMGTRKDRRERLWSKIDDGRERPRSAAAASLTRKGLHARMAFLDTA